MKIFSRLANIATQTSGNGEEVRTSRNQSASCGYVLMFIHFHGDPTKCANHVRGLNTDLLSRINVELFSNISRQEQTNAINAAILAERIIYYNFR